MMFWNDISESEQVEEAKHKKLDNTKAPEPATPDYAAGLTAVTQPAKVSISQRPDQINSILLNATLLFDTEQVHVAKEIQHANLVPHLHLLSTHWFTHTTTN